MGENSHRSTPPLTQNQNDAQDSAALDDPRDAHRLTDSPAQRGSTRAEKPTEQDQQNQATVEELGREGLGVAPKE